MSSTENDLIGVAEAADILGTTPRTALRRIKRGELAAEKLAGKTGAYVLSRAAVEAIAEAAA